MLVILHSIAIVDNEIYVMNRNEHFTVDVVIFLAKVKIWNNKKMSNLLIIANRMIFKNVKDNFACDEQIFTSRGLVK